MTTALQQRLALFYDRSPGRRVMAGQAQWPAGFGRAMANIMSIVPHQTAGWPDRDGADRFVDRYINPASSERGLGPQLYISSDGTTFGLIEMPRETWHATFVNRWAIGVETGLLPGSVANVGSPTSRWRELTGQAEDIPGAKIYAALRGSEIMVCWFTTDTYRTPARQPPGAGEMLLTEWQYRAWALLARWLAEQWGVPRNFPLLPHALRWEHIDDPAAFRRIMLADERFDVILRGLAAYNLLAADFASDAALTPDYQAAVLAASGARARHNEIWLDFFDHYRGFHGHGFSGSIRRRLRAGNWVTTDHDCPGPLFDWHRFAREVWDWWWEPFDFDAAFASTAVPQRAYRTADGDTPLIEYYYDPAVDEQHYSPRITTGIHGTNDSPVTFRLEQGSPVYALANGELVAARFPEGSGVSMAFVLVRHELFHQPSPLSAAAIAGAIQAVWGVRPPPPDRIGYDLEPTYVYSLHMHLGRPAGMSFDAVTPANPDWLNRVIARFIECRDGIPFAAGNYTNVEWANAPPNRIPIHDQWVVDLNWYEDFLISLGNGDLATAPPRMSFATPMRVILGDFLGNAGVIRHPPSGAELGIRVETFTSQVLPAAVFTYIPGQPHWNVPSGSSNPIVRYQSEWARTLNEAARVGLIAIGVDPELVSWWGDVATSLSLDTALPPEAQLPADGRVWHCQPHDLMRWINQVTYRSEWNKYQVTDAAGNPVPFQPIQRPRSRRI